jgi:tetratricopeptide (TPR) repeat protein
MNKINKGHNRLRVTLLAGLILLVLICGAFVFLYFSERSIWKNFRKQDSFLSILREYDAIAAENYGTQREYDRLHHELDRLEKKAISVESWLSILKRRRFLAKNHPPSIENYRSSVNNALKAYPQAEPIIAIASASLVKNSAVNRETENKLRGWLPFLSDPSLNTLRLSLHAILGDLNSPQRAQVLPADIYSDGTESITVNLAVLKVLRSDYHSASAEIQMLLNREPSPEALRFAAEYNYDFGDILRSAELFSMLNSNDALGRQADALYLAGFTDSAVSIWTILADLPDEISLYNLAVTSDNSGIAAGYLEKLVNLETISNSNSRQFGLIRYSRILDYSKALALLRGTINFSAKDYPYIDLEICKRLAQEQNPGQQIAQTWLLLDRHERNEELYKWACWLFFFQRHYDEISILINRMDLLQLNEGWADFYKAINFMVEGKLETAEDILRQKLSQEPDWYVFANYGRILESMRSFARSIAQYELAMEKLQSANPQKNKSAANVQIHIARCYTALKRPSDARRALLFALDFDPDNLTANFELDKSIFY